MAAAPAAGAGCTPLPGTAGFGLILKEDLGPEEEKTAADPLGNEQGFQLFGAETGPTSHHPLCNLHV